MVKLRRIPVMFMLVIIIMLSTCTTAFAAEEVTLDSDGNVTDIGSIQLTWLEENIVAVNSSGITSKAAWMKNYLTAEKEEAATPPIVITTINNKSIMLKKGVTLDSLSKQVKSSMTNGKTVDNVSDITDGLNISADTAGAATMMKGFTPIISLLLGILVTLITVGMTIFSAFDIAYIAFPIFRNKCEEAKTTGNNKAVKTTPSGETTLRWVTDDAQFAVKEGSVESGKSPWLIYFKKRVLSYILLAIILFILVTGNISLIVNIALKVVSGIMDILSGLA